MRSCLPPLPAVIIVLFRRRRLAAVPKTVTIANALLGSYDKFLTDATGVPPTFLKVWEGQGQQFTLSALCRQACVITLPNGTTVASGALPWTFATVGPSAEGQPSELSFNCTASLATTQQLDKAFATTKAAIGQGSFVGSLLNTFPPDGESAG